MSAIVTPLPALSAIEWHIPFEDYLAIDADSFSRLKELKRSPQHYRYRAKHPKHSRPLSLGRAAHCATLEPDRFYAEHAIWTRRQADGKSAPRKGQHWDAFVAEYDGKIIITEDEFVGAVDIQAAVRGNADAMRYLRKGDPEVTFLWPFFGRQLKGRVDWLTVFEGRRPALVGLKTSVDCRPFQFGAQAARYGYHLQWAIYHDGYESITGKAPLMKEIVVESKPPHAVIVYNVPNEVILQGRDEYHELLKLLDECEKHNDWPGPVVGEQDVTLPSWVYGQQTDDLADLDLE